MCYSPLSHLFSLTLQCSYLPTEWKIHKVMQSSNLVIQELPSNFITQQCFLEHIIYNKIVDHVSATITSAQFGFMVNHSTTRQQLLFLHNAFSSRDQFGTIYLDISKAFDTISHSQNFAISTSLVDCGSGCRPI